MWSTDDCGGADVGNDGATPSFCDGVGTVVGVNGGDGKESEDFIEPRCALLLPYPCLLLLCGASAIDGERTVTPI